MRITELFYPEQKEEDTFFLLGRTCAKIVYSIDKHRCQHAREILDAAKIIIMTSIVSL